MRIHLGKSFLGVFVLLAIAIVTALPVMAQDETQGLIFFKMGKNSSTPSSLSTNIGLGGGVAFSPFESYNLFYIEPSVLFNWPKSEYLVFEGDPFPYKTSLKTLVVDFNVSQAFLINKYERFAPYVTGGIGFVRNWGTATDGYYVYQLGNPETNFTKNLGAGLRFFLGENQNVLVSSEWKNYWSGGGNFHAFSGGVGFRF